MGEVARVFFITRGRQQSYGVAASTIVLEHVLDLLVVLGMLLCIVLLGAVPLPGWARQGAAVAGVLLGGALAVIVLMLDGFAVLRPGLPLAMVLLWSVVSWLASAVTYHLALQAFVPGAPFTYALFATTVTTFVLMVPATPGGVGTVQLGIQRALAVFGVPAAVGLGFSIVSHVMGIMVMDLLGVIFLLREAGSWAKAREALRAVTAQVAAGQDAAPAVPGGST